MRRPLCAAFIVTASAASLGCTRPAPQSSTPVETSNPPAPPPPPPPAPDVPPSCPPSCPPHGSPCAAAGQQCRYPTCGTSDGLLAECQNGAWQIHIPTCNPPSPGDLVETQRPAPPRAR
ncbi:MAG: hypothetical protein R3A48_03905 [Polyangiales bacterium]